MEELSNFIHRPFYCSLTGRSVEGLYGKRPIQCLMSSEILTPHPLTARRVCTTPAFGAGGGHTRWVERGWGGVNILEDARHCYVLYISTLWSLKTKPTLVETRERRKRWFVLQYSLRMLISKDKSMLERLHVIQTSLIISNVNFAIWKTIIERCLFFTLIFVFPFSTLPLPRGIGWGEENQREERRLEKWRRQKFA